MRRLASWLPPLVWMGAVLVLGSELGNAATTTRLIGGPLAWLLPWATPAQLVAFHWAIRKVAHLVVYGILAALWLRALTRERLLAGPAGWVALGVAAAWAALDEWIQSTIPSRTGSATDVAIDTVGAGTTLLLARRDWRAVVDRVTAAALWTAALGGALALGVNWVAGVSSVALWITTPVAALVIAIRRHTAASGARRRPRRAPDGDRPW